MGNKYGQENDLIILVMLALVLGALAFFALS